MQNWSIFKKRILINKPLATVYDCWATRVKIETWFLERTEIKSGDRRRRPDEHVQKGDDFTWKWNNWEFTEKGQILEANGRDLMVV